MLKIYNTLEEVPEALREHYKKSDGRYVPDLSEDHPVVVHNKTLLSEKATATGKVRELEADLAEQGKTTVPRGHTAVPKADVDELASFRALGKKPDELSALMTEHSTLKESDSRRQREDKQRLVAKELGYDNVDAFLLLPDHPDYEIRDGKDGKKQVIALVKDGDKTVEKPAQEFLESSPRHAPLLPALKSSGGVKVHGTSTTNTASQPGDQFAWAKQFAADYAKQNPVATQDLFTSFNTGKSA